jgi:hypothetical protein
MNRETWISAFVERLRSMGTRAHPDVLEEIASDFYDVDSAQDPVLVAQDHASEWNLPPLPERQPS